MSDLLDTPEVQNLLTKVSGLGNDKGDARLKQIVHRVVSDLFKTIEEFDIQPDEFWSAMSYLTKLSQANEVGLLVPGLGLETFLDLRMDAVERKAGIEADNANQHRRRRILARRLRLRHAPRSDPGVAAFR
jgi:catechol 1,2-dioxygenase